MNKHTRSSENGQALILLVLGLTVLLGFTALAIDGGMIYSDRRHAQNGSDASSLAGGGEGALSMENAGVTYWNWSCSDGRVVTAQADARVAAVSRAADNDYTIDQNISDNNGVETDCKVVNNGSWIDKYIDIHTMITRDTRTAFAQFIFGGPLRNTVDAITRVRPRTPIAFGNAIVALSTVCQGGTGGVNFMGTSDTSVTGGGIFSNACVTANGSTAVTVNSPYGTTCTGLSCDSNWNPGSGADPNIGQYPLPPEIYDIAAPTDCASLPARSYHGGTEVLLPGRYNGIRLTSTHDNIQMQRGLYCLTDDFRANGGTIEGYGISVYQMSGDIDIAGAEQVTVEAPPARNCDYCPPAMAGVLFYLAKGNQGEISLLGSSENVYKGVIYAPDGIIEVGGTAGEISQIHAQLIAETVDIHGTAEVIVTFSGEENFQWPARLELFK